MDYRNIGMGIDRHTIIYGHYTRYGQMFGELDKFLNEDFLREIWILHSAMPMGKNATGFFPSMWRQLIQVFWILILRETSTLIFCPCSRTFPFFPSEVLVTEDDHILTLMDMQRFRRKRPALYSCGEVTE